VEVKLWGSRHKEFAAQHLPVGPVAFNVTVRRGERWHGHSGIDAAVDWVRSSSVGGQCRAAVARIRCCTVAGPDALNAGNIVRSLM
jgi:hypothetical protein